jgi:hypothetical protein
MILRYHISMTSISQDIQKKVVLSVIYLTLLGTAAGIGRFSALFANEPITITEHPELEELLFAHAQELQEDVPAPTSPVLPESPVAPQDQIPQNPVTPAPAPAQHQFVASVNGKKYYPIGCGGANRIKEENRTYFTTEQEAVAKGYERASQCTFANP